MRLLLHGFNQHGAGLATADTFSGNSALHAFAVQSVHQVQHNAIATGAYRVTKAYRTAIDIKFFAINAPQRRIKAKGVFAEVGTFPCGKAGTHLRSESFVKLPQVNIGKPQLAAL